MQVFSGKFQRRKLLAPKGIITRPTASRLRQTVFNILQGAEEGLDFLDIFAGSGAMGIEALSRGAKRAVFIEMERQALKCLEANLKKLQLTSSSIVLAGDFVRMLDKLSKERAQFGIIYADAPYGLERKNILLSDLVMEKVESGNLLKQNGYLFIENDDPTPPKMNLLKYVNSRRSGKAYLHYFRKH